MQTTAETAIPCIDEHVTNVERLTHLVSVDVNDIQPPSRAYINGSVLAGVGLSRIFSTMRKLGTIT